MAKSSTRLSPDKAARAEIIDYDEAVRKGKEIIARSDADHWLLGELAAKVQPKYKESTLARFAKDVGIAACTLERARSVWRSWHQDISEPAPELPPFAVAQALQNHPDRAELLKENPQMTRAEARRLMRENSGKTADADPKPQEKFDGDRLSSGVVKANKATGLAQDVARLLDDPDHEVTPLQAARCREAAAEWTKTAELYEQRRQQQSPEEPTPEVLDAPALSPVKSESVH